MKKIVKIILIFIIVLLTMLCTKVFATDEDLTYNIELAAPEAGIYGEGQEITIKFTFNKAIKGVMPKYVIYFGKDPSQQIELETEEITEFKTEVLYKYTIKAGDNGELKPGNFVNTSECPIEDEDGTKYYLTSPFLASFETTILADTTIEWTDFSKATIEMEPESEGDNRYFDLLFKNCSLKSENYYYVHLSHDANEEIVVKNSEEMNNKDIWQTNINTSYLKVYLYESEIDMFAEVGDVYITVCEVDKDTGVPKIVLESKKVTKLPSLSLTQRITAYFFDDRTSTYCWDIYSSTNQTKLNYKIGKVTDLNLLKAIKAGEASAFSNLLEYAKKAENACTGTVKLGKDATITDKLGLIDDAYYYVYLQLDTMDGKYVEIEDVSLYQAVISDTVGANLFSISDKNFKWNLDETTNVQDPKPDTTIAQGEIPKAGLEIKIILSAIVAVCVSVILLKKCKKYSDIK